MGALLLIVSPANAMAQAHQHAGHAGEHPAVGHSAIVPTLAGQMAFATVAEIVSILESDPDTDWARVDLEALRQHLVDMDQVVMRSRVATRVVDGGAVMEVIGGGETVDAIRRMVPAHAAELDALPRYRAGAEEIPGGVRLTVTAGDPADPREVARIRGLGFIGLLTEGAHHQPHHLAMAQGLMGAHHH